jgi:hypothetical protein
MKKALLLAFVLLATACKSKDEACTKVTRAVDPIAKDLDALATASETAPPPSPADQASCTRLADEIRRVEDAQARLALLITNDETLAKHLEIYRGHVGAWAKATKQAQSACMLRDGNAMTAGLGEAIKNRSQLGPVKSDITAYCRAP